MLTLCRDYDVKTLSCRLRAGNRKKLGKSDIKMVLFYLDTLEFYAFPYVISSNWKDLFL